jgi:hypothetical protein
LAIVENKKVRSVPTIISIYRGDAYLEQNEIWLLMSLAEAFLFNVNEKLMNRGATTGGTMCR